MSEPTVTTNAPQKPNAMGGTPTTTQDITPTPQNLAPSTQPTAPAPQVSATPQTAQPRPAQPIQPPTPKSLHASIFEGVLKTLGGGTQYIDRTDPTTGATTREPIQQSKGQLGKSILAGALAGMFGGMGARDAEGRHDPLKAAQEGFEAGQKPMQQRVAQLQQTADEDTSRKQMTMKNNMDLMHQQIAMTHMQHQELQTTADNNTKGILADADTYDKGLSGTDVNDKTKQAIQGRGLTYQEALDKLKGNWSNTLAIVDGYQDVRNPQTGQMEPEPTYAVLNPNITIKMSEAQAAAMAKFKPAYQNAYEATGGNLKIPLNRYVADVHQLNSLNQIEAYFENIKDQIPGMKNAPDLAALARDPKTGQQVLSAVTDVENAIGQQGDPIASLQRLAGTGGGALILKNMGITNEQVQTLVNDKTRKEALAKEGGIGDKSPADPDKVAQLPTLAAQAGLTPSQVALVVGKPNKAGMTQGEYKEAVNGIRSQANTNTENSIKQGDPEVIGKLAKNYVSGDVGTLSSIPARGNQRIIFQNAIHDEAERRGLDTTQFSPAALDTKALTMKDYSGNKKGSTGAQIASFNAFTGHLAEAVDASKTLAKNWTGTSRFPLVNQVGKIAAKQVENDSDWKTYQTALIPVRTEITNYLAAGYAPNVEDSTLMHQALDENETPARTQAALTQLARTADIRLAAMGQRYQDTMGTNYGHLVSADSANTFKNLGIPSKASAVGTALPRGWQGDQLSKVTDPNVAKAYVAAANGDRAKAIELAKMNGWSF